MNGRLGSIDLEDQMTTVKWQFSVLLAIGLARSCWIMYK